VTCWYDGDLPYDDSTRACLSRLEGAPA